ncbi:MAG: hypothetical protein ACXVZW_08720 [Gaiellaceae bacterium]
MTLRDYLRVLDERKHVIVLVALLVGAASWLLASREKPKYSSSSQVLLQNVDLPSLLTNTGNPNVNIPPERNASTLATLARVPAVARRALAAAGVQGQTSTGFLKASGVSADPTADLLDFSVSDRRPALAERLATAYARQFTVYLAALNRTQYAGAESAVTRRLEALDGARERGSALWRRLRSEQQQLQALIPLQTANATVVHAATEATRVQPRPLRALAIGAPIGILLGLALALLMHVLDTRARTLADVERWLELPLLGRIPRLPRRLRRSVVMFEAPTSSWAEAFSALRTNVELANRIDGGALVMFTSVTDEESDGKPSTVANLGVAFARAGQRVVLVDLDLRRPSLAGFFDLEPQPGVTEVLLDRAGLDDAMRPVPLHPAPGSGTKHAAALTELGNLEFGGTLRILPAGTLPSNPTDLSGTSALAALLERLRESADIVLVDTPPVLQRSDAVALSTQVDALVVVVRVGEQSRGTLAEMRRTLALMPVARLGFVAVGCTQRRVYAYDSIDRLRSELRTGVVR